MALTRTDLANRALVKLLVVAAGNSPDAEDTEQVDSTLDSIFESLSDDRIYTVQDDQDIKASAFEWLATVVAFYNAQDFGKQADASALEYAEFRLKRLLSSDPTYQVAEGEYF